MAEEIDLDTNLCTTEEEFETFQANSITVEKDEEFITLADILPEQPSQSDVPDVVNYFIDRAVFTNVDERIVDVNKPSELCTDPPQMQQLERVCSPTMDNVHRNNEQQTAIIDDSVTTTTVVKKRGRKKKNVSNNTDLSCNPILNNSNISEDLATESSVIPKETRKQSKTRLKSCEPKSHNIDTKLKKKLSRNKMKTKHMKQKSPNSTILLDTKTAKEYENPENNATVKRRGRPRKSFIENNVSTDEVICKQSKLDKVQLDEDDDMDNMSLSKLKGIKVLKKTNPEFILSDDSSKTESCKIIVDSNISEIDSEQDDKIVDIPNKLDYSKAFPNGTVETDDLVQNDPQLSVLNEIPRTDFHTDDATKDNTCYVKDQSNPINSEDIDDVALSELKVTLGSELTVEDKNLETVSATPNKRNSKMPVMIDFEYNIDKVVNESLQNDNKDELKDTKNLPNESLLVEDTSRRPIRKKVHKTVLYEEESDEDPFANVELSDEEPRRKRGNKYYSDDEYIPGNNNKKELTFSSDSTADEELGTIKKQKRKRYHKKTDGFSPSKSPKKKLKKSNTTDEKDVSNLTLNVATLTPDESKINNDDIEVSLEASVIQASDERKNQPIQQWGNTNEFENFLAKKIQSSAIKIKKVSSTDASVAIAPLDIPVINPNENKKSIEMCTQTIKTQTESTSVQTTGAYVMPMKENSPLTPEVAQSACEFLKGVVKTTAELGQLMTEKSIDFINKKINIEHMTDTFKMDYCVRKSFLLFKLAKSNIVQMEEDLAKQYDEFLSANNLLSCREEEKQIKPTLKVDNDSDCEIVEVSKLDSKEEKKAFNPKTVFLNKELSIKIAKKPNKEPQKKEKLNIKKQNMVWINDSVMVKKVKPSQSFLAQDSRNKKPPDNYITHKAVSDFFTNYYRERAVAICAPFVSPNWHFVRETYVCNYFIKYDGILLHSKDSNTNTSYVSHTCNKILNNENVVVSPKTLFSLCTNVIQKHLNISSNGTSLKMIKKKEQKLQSLFKLCVNVLSKIYEPNPANDYKISIFECEKSKLLSVPSLKTICIKKLSILLYTSNSHENLSQDLINTTKYKNIPMNSNEKNESVRQRTREIGKHKNINVPEKLLSLCVKFVQNEQRHSYSVVTNNFSCTYTPPSLKKITYLFIMQSLQANLSSHNIETIKYIDVTNQVQKEEKSGIFKSTKRVLSKRHTLPLKTITYQRIKQLIFENHNSDNLNTNTYNSDSINMNVIATTKVKMLADICYDFVSKYFCDNHLYLNLENKAPTPSMTINSINTLSEEAYLTIGEEYLETQNAHLEEETDIYNEVYDDFPDIGYEDQITTAGNNWASQVQMKVLRSCNSNNENVISENSIQDERDMPFQEQILVAQIKIEPEEVPETIVHSVNIKTESDHNGDEMTVIPQSIITKMESIDCLDLVSSETVENSVTYDENTFKSFVACNKMKCGVTTNDGTNHDDEIYSQSALRIRRQHEPDSDGDHDVGDSLLIPHGFEPLHEDNAKNYLMGSSSNDEQSNSKKTGKKKVERRNKKTRKCDNKHSNKSVLATSKEKSSANNEVAELTKKMRDRIRQEERKELSSDSESEKSYNLRNMKDARKEKKDQQKVKNKKIAEDEIQCSNVDSTEQIGSVVQEENIFTGFSAVDQNEISSYQKYVKYVYDKIIPTENLENSSNRESNKESVGTKVPECQDKKDNNAKIINFDEPAEMLECEPTLPIFDDEYHSHSEKKPSASVQKAKKGESTQISSTKYVVRNGWDCYPTDKNDIKLYQIPHVPLEKLPEAFVETYFKYQNVAIKKKEDQEVDKLSNLQTLHRTSILREGKINKVKLNKSTDNQNIETSKSSNMSSRVNSPIYDDNYDELTPSEDEGTKLEDQLPPPVVPKQSENTLAKNSLINDNDSESDTPLSERILKREPLDETPVAKNYRPGPKCSKRKGNCNETSGDLILTADKMMNKELTMLHAPVVLTEGEKTKVNTNETPIKGMVTRQKHKILTKKRQDHLEREDDSSEEEEKQWVNTKERLLKRMEKKQENASLDDAKRNKIVSDFIEKFGSDKLDMRSQGSGRRSQGRSRGRRSRRKLLEKQKQMKVLSRELLAEGSTHSGSRFSQSYFKGRRNIRKVIDKKSLARSTVIANMEEFERKRRLNHRQNRLREVLGCEEGVNVFVINDEVCLDYDFENMQPIVTIHPFFTKVMKAHQYEGVKFMWDACFENLEMVESGHPGSGCILAHCMGLGKTLQVLALLHTVLTHPRVGMHRVLVCCPLSTVLNWVDEIHKWIGPVTNEIKVFELSKLKKTYERAYQLEDWYKGGGIFIIGYELFRSLTTLDHELDNVKQTTVNKIRTALLDPGPDIIVCDEGHLLKNDSSVLAVAMSRVFTKRRIVLTGTPMQNNLREYYCMVNFIKPNLLGTYSEYSNRFENPIMNGQHRDSIEADIKLMKARTHILHKVLEGCLQRQEASVLYPYLPKKHEYTVFISMTECQWDLYKHYMNNYSKSNRHGVLQHFHILQKIWSHPQALHHFQMKSRDEKIKEEKLEDDLAKEDLGASEDIKPQDTEVWWLQYLNGGKMLESLESSNKFVVLFKILDECVAIGDKVLIFSTSLITMDTLEYFLKKIKKWSLGTEYYRLDGSVPAEVRQKWCREFNAENNQKTKLFLISTRAGSLGLNMVAANRVIILDTSWNPAHDIQSIFRVYRFGQKKDCYIYRLVAMGTMEQKIYERSVTKQAVACRVVDEQQIDRHYSMGELTELYKYDESGSSVACGVAGGVRDAALLRVARLEALHAVHEHDSLLRGSTEQGLPEHERRAAWLQFQREHGDKQNQMYGNMNLPTKRPLEHDYTLPMVEEERSVKPEPNASLDTEPKPKKGRKSSIVKCNIPVNNQIQTKVSEIDLSNFEKQAREFLLKNNYNYQSNPNVLNELMKNIREKYEEIGLQISQEVAAKLISNLTIVNPAPNLTDVALKEKEKGCPNKDTEFKPNKSKLQSLLQEGGRTYQGRRKRKAAIEAERYMNTFGKDICQDTTEGCQNNSDTESASDQESTSKISSKQVAKKTQKSKTVSSKITSTIVSNELTTKEIPTAYQPKDVDKQPEKINPEESILLSDDEDHEAPIANNKTKCKSNQRNENCEVNKKEEKSDEIIPLHPSLLRNQNFVKIVAHSYLSNNPFLDEDAAFLAAQYSTDKALNIIETEGKEICSGPIYDIAMKVLGKSILQKLNRKTLDSKEKHSLIGETRETDSPLKEQPVSQQYTSTKTVQQQTRLLTNSTVEKANLINKVKVKRTSELMMNVAVTSTVTSATSQIVSSQAMIEESRNPLNILKSSGLSSETLNSSTPAVVPVGLIQRMVHPSVTSHNTASEQINNECILPDDDDIRLISDPVPPPVVLPTTTNIRNKPGPKSVVERRTQNILANNSVSPSVPRTTEINAYTTTPPSSSTRQTEIRSGINATKSQSFNNQHFPVVVTSGSRSDPGRSQPSVSNTVNNTPSISECNTICLDSDDEDTFITDNHINSQVPMNNTNQIPPPVVPVTLTAANPSAAMMMLNQTPVPNIVPQLASLNTVNNSRPNVTLSTSSAYTVQSSSPIISKPNPLPFITVDGTKIRISPQLSLSTNNAIKVNAPAASNNPSNNNVSAVPIKLRRLSKLPPNIKPIILPVNQEKQAVSTISGTQDLETADNKLAGNKTVTKTVCKAGDVFRIKSDGQVEVLRKEANYKPASTTPDEQQTIKKTEQQTNVITDKQPERTQSKPTLLKESPQVLYSSNSSDSDSSRPTSPDDPLAILNNVVKIVPAEYNDSMVQFLKDTTKFTADSSNKKTLPTPPTMKTNTNVASTKPSNNTTNVAARTVSSSKVNAMAKATIKDNKKVIALQKDTTIKDKKKDSTLKTSKPLTAAQQPHQSRKSVVNVQKIISVDLTGPSSPKSLNKQVKSKQPEIKAIINLTDSDVAVKHTPTKCTPKATSKSTLKAVPVKVETKPSTSASMSVGGAVAKKRRIDQMTLKDFDIDDIDDIIELE